MPSSLSNIAAKDGAASTVAGGILAVDKSGAGTGPFFAAQTLVDTQGVNTATIKAASTASVAGDTALVVAISPNNTVPVSLTSTTITGTVAVTESGTWTVQPGNTANTTPWLAKVGDGTNSAAIKAASTAAVATDPALVVAISPNNTLPVSLTSTTITGTVAVTESGTWTVQPGNTANTTPWLAKIGDGTNSAAIKPASTAAVATDPALVVAISPNSVNANGQTTMSASAPVTLSTDQKYQTGMSPRAFSVAFSTLTRPANTTAYSAGNSISDNATAGSVTALSATISDTNDDPLTLTEILISSTDTGLAGKRIRAYLFNSDPTASTGVVNGNGAAYSQKKAGYIGSMSGVMETGFSDGTVGRLVPSFNDSATSPTPNAAAGGFIVTKPTAGAKTLYIQYQAIDAFTPSANSTTIIGTARGFQGRAA